VSLGPRSAVSTPSQATTWAQSRQTSTRGRQISGPKGARSSSNGPTVPTTTTNGAATTLTGTISGDWSEESSTRSGVQARVAATDTDTDSARTLGTWIRWSSPVRVGPSRAMPRHAATESRKPTLVTCQGSAHTSTVAAAATRTTPTRGRPATTATAARAPMTAALSTGGSGPTSTTNAPTAPTESSAAAHRGSRSTRPRPATAEIRTEMFEPDTAVTWLSPACVIASLSRADCRDRSPATMPGTSAAPPSASPPR
jgi:hypothetical protein